MVLDSALVYSLMAAQPDSAEEEAAVLLKLGSADHSLHQLAYSNRLFFPLDHSVLTYCLHSVELSQILNFRHSLDLCRSRLLVSLGLVEFQLASAVVAV